jgi:hypothetical protein
MLLSLMPLISSVETKLVEDEIEHKFDVLSNTINNPFFHNILRILLFFWLISPIIDFIIVLSGEISISDFNLLGLITFYYSTLVSNLYYAIFTAISFILLIIFKIFGDDEYPWGTQETFF